MEKIGERVRKLRKHLKLSQGKFAEGLPIGQAGISYIEKGGGTTYEIINALVKKYGISTSWLVDGKGEMLENTSKLVSRETPIVETKGNIIHVPIKAQAGFMRGYENEIYIDSLEHYSLPGVHGQYFSFHVDNYSMHLPGHTLSATPLDTIIADRQRVEKFEDLIKGKGYVLITIEGVCYKQFENIEGKKAYFNSLNKDYPNYEGNLKDIKATYFVDFILRKT